MLIISYLKYLFRASYYNGHGVHSPYIYKFVREVLFASNKDDKYLEIKQLRRKLLANKSFVDVTDLGAGSRINNNLRKKISTLAATSAVRHKYGKLLSRMIKFYKPQVVVELGTSLGISGAYLCKNMTKSDRFYTIEADKSLVNIAENNLQAMTNTNVNFINENFDKALPDLINNEPDNFDFVFIDGNHQYAATIKYFNQLIEKINNNTIFVFDDIHWSKDMERAWDYIISHTKTKVSIDIFQFGIVFFCKELSKQHYVIRF